MKIITASMLCIALAGCAGTKIVKETEKVGIAVYPNLLPMDAPQGFDWERFVFDVPRDMTAAPVAKASPECKAVLASKRDTEFWKICGEQPPLKNSNVIVGLDEENLNILRQNLATSAAKEDAWRNRLDEVNAQREEWRNKNQDIIAATGAALDLSALSVADIALDAYPDIPDTVKVTTDEK